MGKLATTALLAGSTVLFSKLLATGELTLDTGLGRRTRPLGPQSVDIASDRETVFDVVAQPYLGRATRAMKAKVEVLHRGEDLVLAAHHTPTGAGLTTTTVETVGFERPGRVTFRLVRGPVPHVVEAFDLTETATGTRLDYTGEMGTDFGALGQRWGDAVARKWEATVAQSLASIRDEAQRRSR